MVGLTPVVAVIGEVGLVAIGSAPAEALEGVEAVLATSAVVVAESSVLATVFVVVVAGG